MTRSGGMPLAVATVALAAAILVPAAGSTDQPRYRFDGGTAEERQVMLEALRASSFDWSVIPATITVHIARGVASGAAQGDVWLDADLLDSGAFAFGVVQHEFAHQVDYFLFDDAIRSRLLRVLGGQDWCYSVLGLPHQAYGCERFASTLAWAYWPSPDNSMRPVSAHDESAALPPRRFRELVGALLRDH